MFPQAAGQWCIVHQVRASRNSVCWKQRKAVAADLQPIYRASTIEEAGLRLDEFAAKWDGTYPTISPIMSLRKVIKTRGWFPTQGAALKLLYLALEHIAKKWTMPVQNGKAALPRFAIIPGDRVPQAEMA